MSENEQTFDDATKAIAIGGIGSPTRHLLWTISGWDLVDEEFEPLVFSVYPASGTPPLHVARALSACYSRGFYHGESEGKRCVRSDFQRLLGLDLLAGAIAEAIGEVANRGR